MDNSFIKSLLQKYSNGSITVDELEQLFKYVETNAEAAKEAIAEDMAEHEADPFFLHKNYDNLIGRVLSVDKGTAVAGSMPATTARRVPLFKTTWFKYAAAAIIIAGLGIYMWNSGRLKTEPGGNSAAVINEVVPGKNGAILTLADGTILVLDSLSNGIVSVQNGAEVTLKDGTLTYHTSDNASIGVTYNTMSTPRGRQFSIVLPDGTKVWLNSASSIRYPTVFTGAARRVDITGEAYFEVTENPAMPFKLNIDNHGEIEVLGTKFNVNAYTDEPAIVATLLHGSIKTSFAGMEGKEGTAILKPGEQAIVNTDSFSGNAINIQKADIEKVMAWKYGLFNFEDASLAQVMRQLSRWYDIEIVYEKEIPDSYFMGEMGRDMALNDVLTFLEKTGVRFRLEGRRLIVQP